MDNKHLSSSEWQTGDQDRGDQKFDGPPQGLKGVTHQTPPTLGEAVLPSMAGKSVLRWGCQETKNRPINARATSHHRTITLVSGVGEERRSPDRMGDHPMVQPMLRSHTGLRRRTQEGRFMRRG